MKLWPVEVWEQWRAGRAQQRFLALTARPRPPDPRRRPLAAMPTVNRALRRFLVNRLRRLELAQYGNLHGSVGVVLPRQRLVDWSNPSPEAKRAWGRELLLEAKRQLGGEC